MKPLKSFLRNRSRGRSASLDYIVLNAKNGEWLYSGPNQSEAKNLFVRHAVANQPVQFGTITTRGKVTISVDSTKMDKQQIDRLYREWVYYPGGRTY